MSTASAPAIAVKYAGSVTKGRTDTHVYISKHNSCSIMEADYRKEGDQLQLLLTY